MPSRTNLGLVPLVALFVGTVPATAQTPSAPSNFDFEALLIPMVPVKVMIDSEEGKELFARGDSASALPRLKQVRALLERMTGQKPTP